MRFFRQTLLSVCLILPFAVWGQPVANDDNANTNEDSDVSFNVLTNDVPGPGIDPATVDLNVSTTDIDNFFSLPEGDFSVDALGEVTFSPALDFAGVVTLFYTVQNSDDNALTSNQALITVNVAQVNDLPVISSILNQTIDEDTQTNTLDFTVGDVETAPGDLIVTASSDNLGLVPVSEIVFGGSDADRTVQITPLPDQNGTVSITLTVDDGTDTQQMSFTLTVDAVNDLPAITGIVDQTINENGQTGLLAFTVNDLETPAASLTVTASSGNTTLIPDANIELVQNGGDWTVQAAPALNETGVAIITLTVTDGDAAAVPTSFQVTVNNNTPPTISSITNLAIDEDTQTAALEFTVGDGESAPGDLIVTASSDNTGLIPVSNIVLGGSGATRTVQITPLLNQNGDALITLTVDDGTDTQQTSFTLTVNSVNDLPTITGIVDQTINENSQTGLLAFTVNDLETPAASLTVTASSGNPTLIPDANIELVQTGADWTVQATPALDVTGVATITLTVTDGDTGSEQTSFQVTVNAVVNTLPTITSITNQAIDEDTQTTALAFTVGDAETAPGDLIVTASSDNTALIPVSNIVLGGSGATQTVQITPLLNQNGDALITLTVDDGSDTQQTSFTVTVSPVNDLPSITGISNQTIDENDQTALLGFTVNDLETAAASLSVTASSGNTTLIPEANIELVQNGANWTVQATPAQDETGVAIITLTVTDGDAGSEQTSFQVTVNAVVNTPPTITSITNQAIVEDTQTAALGFTVGDAETAPGDLTVSASSGNTGLVPVSNIVFGGSGANRTVQITPLPNQNGNVLITLTVADGTDTQQTAFTLTVSAINDAPTITGIVAQNINEDSQTGLLAFVVGDVETAPGDLIVSGVSSNTDLVENSDIVISGTGANRSVTITPLPNESGGTTITLTVSDGSNTAQTAFVVTVNPVDDVPTITSITNQTITENSQTGPLAFTIDDKETQPTLLQLTPASSNTALVDSENIVLGGSGSLRNVNVIPKINQIGTTTISLTVSDGENTAQTAFQVMVTNLDAPPTITAILDQLINEDTQTGALPFTVDDPDTGAAGLLVSGVSDNPTLVPNLNIVILEIVAGSWTVQVTPVGNESGVANITLTVTDGVETADISFSVTVSPVNDPPTFTKGADRGDDEDAGAQSVPNWATAINDGDGTSQTLTFNVSNNNNGLFSSQPSIAASGTLTYTPAANASGTATVSVTLSDDGSNIAPNSNTSAQQTFAITVDPVNDAPFFTKGADQVIDENAGPQTVSNWATGMVDGDGTSQLLTFNVTNTNNPLFSVQPSINAITGTLTYTPAANTSGSATVSVTLSDNGSNAPPHSNISAQQTFTITVNDINNPPVFTIGANQVDNEDAGAQSVAGWATGIGDGDGTSQSLTFNIGNDNPSLFSVQPSINATNGTLTYTPAANANGTANLSVTLSDDGSNVAPSSNTSAAQGFTITVSPVNDAPVFTKGADQVIDENAGPQTVSNWATGIVDGDGTTQGLTFNVTNNNNSLFSVQPSINAITGTLTYTPAANTSGSATVAVTLSDNGPNAPPPNSNISAQQTFTITVNNVNNPPVFTIGANQVDNEDAGAQSVPGWATGISDGDGTSQTLTFNVSSDVPSLFSVQPAISAAGTLTYTPAPNANGATTVTVSLSDNGPGTAPDDNTSAPQMFTITIDPINDAPFFTKGSDQVINENAGAQTVSNWATNINDGDGTSQTLTFNVSNNNNPLFSVQPSINPTTGTLTYTPAANANGMATVSITLSDNGLNAPPPNSNTSAQQTFTITVSEVNDPPVFTKGLDQNINEDAGAQSVPNWATGIGDGDGTSQTLTFNVSNDNNALFTAQPSISAATGTLTYTPAANAFGTANISVTLSDDGSNVPPSSNTSAQQTFTIIIDPINDAPTISVIGNQTVNEDNATGNIAFTIGDVETAAASLTVTASSSNTTLVPNGNITLGGAGPSRTINITPAANLSGVTTITVNVNDGLATTQTTFTLTVNTINDAPTISEITDQVIVEDTPTGALAFTVGDVETPAGSLTVTPSSSNTTLIPIGNIVLGGSGAARTVTITPATNQTGATTITLSVDDGLTSMDTDFLVTVTGVNDPPTISNITDRTINEDTQTGIINFTISDPESAATTLVVTGSSSNPTLVPDANITLGGTGTSRTVNVIPAANQFGVTTITVNVSDGTNSTPETFDVTVNSVNDVPVITNQVPITVNEVQPVVLSLPQLTVVDPDNTYPDDFTLLVLGGANYTITGLTTITPFPNFSGVLTVPVFVSDGTAFSAIFNLLITVNSTNDAPVITGQTTLAINEDQTIMLQLTDLTVTDPDNTYPDDFTLTVLAGSNYTFSGTTITPSPNYNGTLGVSVKVNDGSVDSAPYNVQITITPVNDPPSITAQSPLSTNEDAPLTLVIGNFTVTDPEPTTYTLAVSQTPGPNYSVSGNTITPDLNFSGTLTVPVTASDGVLNSAVFNAQIQVNAVNDAPVITGQAPLTTVEDTPLTLVLADLTVTDTDNTFPTGFSLTVQAGTNYTFSGNTITPALDYVGDVFVNVTVSDGTTSSAPFLVLVDVTDASDAPVITGQNAVSLNEDQSRAITISDIVFTDPDTPANQQTLSVLAGTNYTTTGNTITPSANFFGNLSVNVSLFDGQANSNTFQLQVTVNPVNDAPFFNTPANITILEDAAQQSITITGITSGPLESQPLLLSVQSSNTVVIPQPVITPAYNGTSATATFTFKPEPNTSGSSILTIRVVDPDFAEHSVTITVNVTSVNDAPTLAAIVVDPIIEDAPEQIIPLTGIGPGGGPSESNQMISIIQSKDGPDLLEIFEVDYTAPASTGSMRIKPKPNANGTVEITVRVQDDGPATPSPNVNFTTRTFDLVITSVNDLPEFVSEGVTNAEPGKPYEYQIEVIDVDGDVIILTAPTIADWLTFTPGTNGMATLSGTPPAGTSGDFSIELEASDPSGSVVESDYTITVNSRPVVSPVTITLNEDDSHAFKVSDFAPGFADADSNPIAEIQITKLPVRGALTFQGNPVAQGDKIQSSDLPSLIFTPLTDSTKPDTLRWNAGDGFMLYSLLDTYAVMNIIPLNDAPIITVMEPETDTIKYELGSEVPVLLTAIFDGYDPDDDNITSAEIGFKRIGNYQYREENEQLIFQSTPKISGSFNGAAGILTLSGTATAEEYKNAIRTIRYNYEDVTDLLDTVNLRSVYVSMSDNKGATSLQKDRIIKLVYTFSDLNIPSAFTPNVGDDVNPAWVISSPNGTEQYNNAEIKIYNKRGILLYEAKGFEKPWNGVWNGEVLPSDTYYYTIDLKYNRVRYKGTVTLLR